MSILKHPWYSVLVSCTFKCVFLCVWFFAGVCVCVNVGLLTANMCLMFSVEKWCKLRVIAASGISTVGTAGRTPPPHTHALQVNIKHMEHTLQGIVSLISFSSNTDLHGWEQTKLEKMRFDSHDRVGETHYLCTIALHFSSHERGEGLLNLNVLYECPVYVGDVYVKIIKY